jgi:hypothetical protein
MAALNSITDAEMHAAILAAGHIRAPKGHLVNTVELH